MTKKNGAWETAQEWMDIAIATDALLQESRATLEAVLSSAVWANARGTKALVSAATIEEIRTMINKIAKGV